MEMKDDIQLGTRADQPPSLVSQAQPTNVVAEDHFNLELEAVQPGQQQANIERNLPEQPNLDVDNQRRPPWQGGEALNDHMQYSQWRLFVVGTCFAAVGVALQALQTPKPLPSSFHCFCIVLELSFAALVVSVYVHQRYQGLALILEHIAVFFGATAFLVAITMNFPPTLLIVSLAVYFLALIVIFMAKYYGDDN